MVGRIEGRTGGRTMPSVTTKKKNKEYIANAGHPRFILPSWVTVVFIFLPFNTLSMPQMI